ncbi:MAG: hypothetical protein KDB07_10615, partial [Planctomycetes bacterium]|nr:hypothetical protein [Planctomycetota bacterium]
QISWENYLKQRGLTHEELYEQIYEKAELIVLRRRLVHYWEMTTTGAQILSIRCESKTVADRILSAIDDEILKGKEVKATFNKHAVLNTSHNESPLQYAFIESPIPDALHKAIFTDLSVGKYSSVLKINDNDYRIVYLDTKHVREARPFKDLQKLIDEEPAIDNDDRYRRWVNAVYKSGRYRVQFRFPGRDTITTATEHDIAKSNEVKDKGGKPQR